MNNRRYRPLIFAALTLAAVWVVALTIFHFAANSKMTAAKLEQYSAATDLNKLSGSDRDKAISDFSSKINGLTYEERLKWRRDEDWKRWFAAMTEAERLKFIEATLPTGFKQMMDAFSQLSDDRRKKVIDDAMKRLRDEGANGVNKTGGDYGKNGPPPLSPELEDKVRELGLKEFYSDSSAETKAELAPLVEQMQQQVRSGRMH
ncbi:MAG TPA: hypothetical protein VG347_16720 [Verrucomicrobiae bacterium]|nr:hypothetical protein [Verrucomicrobiae bacterium]